MWCTLRIQYHGANYSVMNRGDHREAIFRDDEDREKFLARLGEACRKTEWQFHACCPMSNHPGKEIPQGSEAGRKQFALLMEKWREEACTADGVRGCQPQNRACCNHESVKG